MYSVTKITQDMLSAGAAPLRAGESYWRTEIGNLHHMYVIHDEQASHQGNEVFRLSATLVDEKGQPIIRPNGVRAVDPLGHTHQIYGGAPEQVEQSLISAIAHYLERMDGAFGNMQQADALHNAGFVVKSSQAHSVPEYLPHLRAYHGID